MRIVYINDFEALLKEIDDFEFADIPRYRLDTVESEGELNWVCQITFTAILQNDFSKYLVEFSQVTGPYREGKKHVRTTEGKDRAEEMANRYVDACEAAGQVARIGKIESIE